MMQRPRRAVEQSVLKINEAYVHARTAFRELGVAWPSALEEATRRYLRSHRLPALDGEAARPPGA